MAPESQSGLQKVLIVDDSATNREMLSELLRAEYAVLVGKNGEEVLELAQQHQPDVILLDVIMPEVDGYEVLRRLKEDARPGPTPESLLQRADERLYRAKKAGRNRIVGV